MTTSFEFEVKVTEENEVAINKSIREIENGKNYGTINYGIIVDQIQAIENVLHVSKENLVDSCIDVDCHASDFHAKRKDPMSSTQFTIYYKTDGWYLVNIRRATVRVTKERWKFNLSKKADEEWRNWFINGLK